MSSDRGWFRAPDNALSWLESVSTDGDSAGYGVGPMPDKVLVLHPLSERLDRKSIDEGRQIETDEHGHSFFVDDPTAVDPPSRLVRWDTYARRRNIPMLRPGGRPGLQDALPGVWHDPYVSPPGEGEIADAGTEQALFDILIRHSAPHTMCTAYFYEVLVGDPLSNAPQPPHVLRGPLDAWNELIDRTDCVLPPQNLWPDDHRWALETHIDSWATAISGPKALIDDLIASPDLEAVRLRGLG